MTTSSQLGFPHAVRFSLCVSLSVVLLLFFFCVVGLFTALGSVSPYPLFFFNSCFISLVVPLVLRLLRLCVDAWGRDDESEKKAY